MNGSIRAGWPILRAGWPIHDAASTRHEWGGAWGTTSLGRAFAFLAAILIFAAGSVSTHAQVQATSVPLLQPAGVAYDAAGDMYIAELAANVVLKVDVHGIVTTIAGTGEQGFGGDGGPATSAVLDSPAGIALDSSGNIYIADSHNNRIRKIDGNGNISTIAGTGVAGFSGDGHPATSATLNLPFGIAVDSSGNIYVADTNNHRIRKIDTSGNINTIAGNGDQGYESDGVPATTTGLDSPNGIAVDSTGNIYITDTHNQRVRKIDTNGTISTFAGSSVAGFSGDGTAASGALLSRPRGIAVDSAGNVYIVDSDNQRLRTVTAAGTITTLAGDGEQGFSGDAGTSSTASLNEPLATGLFTSGGVTAAAVADADNQRVRTIDTTTTATGTITGTINTTAGTAAPPVTSGPGSGPSSTPTPTVTISLGLAGASTEAYSVGSIVATITNSGKAATGMVTLLENGQTLSTGTLSSNTTTLTVPARAVGIHDLVAIYPGDSNNPAVVSGLFVLTVTPAPVTAAANPISVLYGQPIPAVTGTLSGILPQDTTNITAAWSTTAVQGSPAGVWPISCTLSGSAASNYVLPPSGVSGSVIISAASSSTTLTSFDNPANLGAPVVLTATVTSSAGTPSGTVTISDGSTPISTGTLISGIYSFSTNALALGTHSLTATYTPATTNFAASTSTALTEVINSSTNFSIAPAPNSTPITISPGGTATFPFVLTPNPGPFADPITFSVDGLPVGATATFTPSSVTLNGSPVNVTMTVQTQALAMLHRGAVAGGTIAFGLLLWPFFTRRRKSASRFARLTATLLLMLGTASATTLLSGCAGSGGFFGQPPQTYTLTVTATSMSTAGVTLHHTTTVVLTLE